jgi:hypothetical protein
MHAVKGAEDSSINRWDSIRPLRTTTMISATIQQCRLMTNQQHTSNKV